MEDRVGLSSGMAQLVGKGRRLDGKRQGQWHCPFVCGLLWPKNWGFCCTGDQLIITSFQAHDLELHCAQWPNKGRSSTDLSTFSSALWEINSLPPGRGAIPRVRFSPQRELPRFRDTAFQRLQLHLFPIDASVPHDT